MTVNPSIDPARPLEEQLAQASPDLLRELLGVGVPPRTAMDIAGHSTIEILQRSTAAGSFLLLEQVAEPVERVVLLVERDVPLDIHRHSKDHPMAVVCSDSDTLTGIRTPPCRTSLVQKMSAVAGTSKRS